MKTLVFGQYNPFVLGLASRLKKESHQTFVITGKTNNHDPKPNVVFQEYNFKYDDNSIMYILNSIEPDVVVFCGAIDSNYEWDNSSHPTKFVGDVARIMNQCAGSRIKKFIYLSSLDIFEGYNSGEGKINRNLLPVPLSDKSKAIFMGEKICSSYIPEVSFPIHIVRLGEVYGAHNDKIITGDICSEFCENILNNETVVVNEHKPHNLIYINDAVENIYKSLIDDSLESMILHAASPSGKTYTESEIIKIIENVSDKKANIKLNNTISNGKKLPKYVEEDDQSGSFEKYNIENGIKLLVAATKNKKKIEKREGRKRFSLKREYLGFNDVARTSIGAIISNIVFFIFLQALIILTRDFSFHEVVDLYILYVAVMAVIYGYKQAILAVGLSVIGKIVIAMTVTSNFITVDRYGFYLWIIQIFVIGVMIGYLKDKYKRHFVDYEEEKQLLTEELKSINRINSSNIEVKNLYERRILDYKDSFVRIHQVVSSLDAIELDLVIFKSVKVICELMNTQEVSIYVNGKGTSYYRLAAGYSKNTGTFGKSLSRTDHPVMFDKLNKNEIYVNKDFDKNNPVLAGGTYSGDQLETIIMIWSLPYGSNNLYSTNIFSVLCKLIEGTMSKAYNYMEGLNEAYQREYDNSIDQNAFTELLNRYKAASEEGLTEYSLLKLLPPEDMKSDTFFATVHDLIRSTDYVYIDEKEESAYLLLTNTNKSEIVAASQRFKNRNIIVQSGEHNGF